VSAITMAAERERQADRVLAERGLAGTVRSAGHQSEIAVLSHAPERWVALSEPERHEVLQAVKSLGYRYVALDLDPLPDRGA
jgi:PP-loop superfamily ATP-utilizing enzyme